MKPVIIVGKGPSAIEIPKSDDYMVAALNGAARLCESIDWLFMNDRSALKEVSLWDMLHVKKLVVPVMMHEITSGKKQRSSTDLIDILGEFIQLSTHRLHTTAHKPWMGQFIPCFGRVMSVGETAIAFLIAEGYRDFKTVGIDGEGGYHEMFTNDQQTKGKRASYFSENVARMILRVTAAGGTIERHETPASM